MSLASALAELNLTRLHLAARKALDADECYRAVAHMQGTERRAAALAAVRDSKRELRSLLDELDRSEARRAAKCS